MSASVNDNYPAALRAALEAAETAICGQDDDDELVANLSYVVALALDHRLDAGRDGIAEPRRLLTRIAGAAIDILADWKVGKTAGLKRLREFKIVCSSSDGTNREDRP